MQQSGLRPTNHCSLPKWTYLTFWAWGRRNRQRLLNNMGGCGMKNWIRKKEKRSWSHSNSHFTTLTTWRF